MEKLLFDFCESFARKSITNPSLLPFAAGVLVTLGVIKLFQMLTDSEDSDGDCKKMKISEAIITIDHVSALDNSGVMIVTEKNS